MLITSLRVRASIMVILAVAGVALLASVPAIPQPPGYHDFADARTFFGIPRAFDVLSNLPFLLVGVLGLTWASRWSKQLVDPHARQAYEGFFIGVLLTAFGSSYYHLAPTNDRLFWDRLPMALGFMSLYAAQLGERVDARLTRALLAPLVALGVFSVTYWAVTEHAFQGDLRPYYFVQGFPVLTMPVMLAFFPSRYDGACWLWATVALYALAEVLESNDEQIFEFTHRIISGHTLKHLAAAGATATIYPMLMNRRARPLPQPPPR